MLPDIQRTIVALASPPRPADRAIIRIAGPETAQVLKSLCPQVPDNFLHNTTLQWCECTCLLPTVPVSVPVTLLYWPDERSYTGTPAAELHLVGCVPLADAIINRCCELGAEPAGRGEFTLRAFLAGKLDLAQAEAVLGVIEADSEQSLRTALSQLGGNLAPAIAPLRASLIDIVAELEAGLDFVDEDIQFISNQQVISQLREVSRQLEQFAARLDTRSSTDRVPQVVLTGLPNSGKSSLFNALCQQSLAIVSDIPGTTRDYLQHRVKVQSAEFDLIDTAGSEELDEPTPRAMAQAQLAHCLAQAQLGLLCIELTCPELARDYWEQLQATAACSRWLVVGTKSDLCDEQELANAQAVLNDVKRQLNAAGLVLTCSSHFDENHSRRSIERLMESIARELLRMDHGVHDGDWAGPLAVVHETAVRCRAALSAARSGIAAALEMAECGGGEELITAELRLVLDDLATIIGEVHSDDVLGEIFSRFCIGK